MLSMHKNINARDNLAIHVSYVHNKYIRNIRKRGITRKSEATKICAVNVQLLEELLLL